MLSATVSDDLVALADRLASVLAEPLADPLATEWVAVPSSGMQRWLELQLASTLGASSPTARDGISANIAFTRPGTLRNLVLQSDPDRPDDDPWEVSRLVWSVLHLLTTEASALQLPALPLGASHYAWARRAADRFDRYHVHRPDMVRAWAAGHDLDARGRRLDPAQAWQPRLWRATRALVGVSSPPERLPGLLEHVRSGDLALAIPPRLSVFGLTVLPGGRGFLEVAQAIGARYDLHLLLVDPSPATARLVVRGVGAAPEREERRRTDDTWLRANAAIEHPLLRSWGRLPRETAMLLADAGVESIDATRRAGDAPHSCLGALQSSIREGKLSRPIGAPDGVDRTVQVHGCVGDARQVEVLRDALLHLLADDPTLTEDDILVVSPALTRFAPLVRASFGTATPNDTHAVPLRAPRLRCQLTDRSLSTPNPVARAAVALLDLLSGPFDVVSVLDFCALIPVRQRFAFDDDALDQIRSWAGTLHVRWGLDGPHRSRAGVPADFEANSWRAGVDRLLLGATVTDTDEALTIDDVLPESIEGEAVTRAGNLAELLARLGRLVDETRHDRGITGWTSLLRDACADLFVVERSLEWQLEAVRAALLDVDESVAASGATATPMPFTDARRVVTDELTARAGRAGFFRGGVTVTSMVPLRWVPHRVVCILGLDQSAMSVPTLDGDDLTTDDPRLGDPDRRAEAREALLETVLAAREHLIVTRNGHDVNNNAILPEAVVVTELRDALTATCAGEDLHETSHPRQASDARCFTPGALGVPGPWGFDPSALAGAQARRVRSLDETPFMPVPVDAPTDSRVELAHLHAFLKNPTRAFLVQTLDLRLPFDDHALTDHLPVDLEGLEAWHVKQRLLGAALDGDQPAGVTRERARGSLPVGSLGDLWLALADPSVTAVADAVRRLGGAHVSAEPLTVDVELPDGSRLTGAIERCGGGAHPGPMRSSMSRLKPTDRLAAWLDLLVLVASEPDRAWRSIVVAQSSKSTSKTATVEAEVVVLVPIVDDDASADVVARAALQEVVDLWRRARREPVPLFPALSEKVHRGQAKPSDWRGFSPGSGDGADAAVKFVYGESTLRDLEALPARSDDPVGVGGRLQHFADALWGIYDRTVVDVAATLGDGEP